MGLNLIRQIMDIDVSALDAGGGAKKAFGGEPDGPVLILNGDSFWVDGAESNIRKLKRAWDPTRMDMMLVVATADQATGFEGAGDFFMNQQAQLTRRGSAATAPFIYAGAIVTTVGFLRTVSEPKFSFNQLFDAAIQQNRLYGLALDGLWLHVGTPASIGEAEQAIDRHTAQHRPGSDIADP